MSGAADRAIAAIDEGLRYATQQSTERGCVVPSGCVRCDTPVPADRGLCDRCRDWLAGVDPQPTKPAVAVRLHVEDQFSAAVTRARADVLAVALAEAAAKINALGAAYGQAVCHAFRRYRESVQTRNRPSE